MERKLSSIDILAHDFFQGFSTASADRLYRNLSAIFAFDTFPDDTI